MYHTFRIRSCKHGTTCNQCICTGSYQAGTCLQIHTTIHFYQCFRTGTVYQSTQFPYLLNCMFDKFLSAKTGMTTVSAASSAATLATV